MRYQRSSLQRKLAEELTKAAGITISEEDYEICEIEQFQRILASENIAIMISIIISVLSVKAMYDGCVTFLPRSRTYVSLNIMYYEDSRHYNPILNTI